MRIGREGSIQRLRERLRTFQHRFASAIRAPRWFPHLPIASLMAVGGALLIYFNLPQHGFGLLHRILGGHYLLTPADAPVLVLGIGMVSMALGLAFRSRTAWAVASMLVLAALLLTFYEDHLRLEGELLYLGALLVTLLLAWRSFDRSSVAAGTLFALTAVILLLLYATFGSLYLGDDFKPPIHDLVTAFYVAVVTMSTVGYGDYTPQTDDSKLFTISVIVLGVAVFATSLTAVIAPLVSKSLERVVNRKDQRMNRENHYIVVGNNPLATNTCRELEKRGRHVTRILRENPEEPLDEAVDALIGDPSSTEVLKRAGADKAAAVLAMLQDDSENAFVVLAVKELGGKAQTIAAVNDARHQNRLKLVQPDVLIAPQVLGGELLAMMLSGERVTPEFVMERVFHQEKAAPRDDG
jgi:K+ transport systems, NAD-binding component